MPRARTFPIILVSLLALLITSCSDHSGGSESSSTPSGPVSRIAVTLTEGDSGTSATATPQDVTLTLGGLPYLELHVNVLNDSSYARDVSLGVVHIDDTTGAASNLSVGSHLSLGHYSTTSGWLISTLVAGKYQLIVDGEPLPVMITVLQADGVTASTLPNASTTTSTPPSG